MSAPEVVLDGLAFPESPRWHDGRLWFAHWGAREVVAVDAAGAAEVVARVPATLPFCIDPLPDGRMLVVSGPEGRVLRREAGGSLVPHADLTPLSRHAWNEIAVDAGGSAYVNGIGFGMMAGEPFAPGLIALVSPAGAVRLVAGDLHFPNGMALSPDGGTLIVAESYGRRLTAFDVAPVGGLEGRRVWADLGDGVPDGICIDAEGAVWYADVPHRRCVRVREGGEVLATVAVDRGCFACALGPGPALYVCAARWDGPEGMAGGPRTGQVLRAPAPAPAAARPGPRRV